jgi:hypothetical protein
MKIFFQIIVNLSEMIIRQLEVTQRDSGRNQNVGTRIDEDTTIQWVSNPLYQGITTFTLCHDTLLRYKFHNVSLSILRGENTVTGVSKTGTGKFSYWLFFN